MRNRVVISKSIKKIGFLLSFHFLLVGCLFFQPSTSDIKSSSVQSSQCAAGNAGFIATQISKQEATITFNPDEHSLRDEFTLNLKTCLKNSFEPDVSLQTASFEVSYYSNLTNQEEKVLARSGPEGCIQWSETYKYKYTLRSTWIGLERVIKQPNGPYKGAVKIKTAVNPWISEGDKESGRPAILDMRCEYANHAFFNSTGSVFHKSLSISKKLDGMCDQGEEQGDKKSIYYEDGLRFLETADHEKPLLWTPTFLLQIDEVGLPSEEADLPSEESSDRHKENNSNALKESKIKKNLFKYRKSCETQSSKDCYKRFFKFDFRVPLEFRSMDTVNIFDTKLVGGKYHIKSSLLITSTTQGKTSTYTLSECENKDVKPDKNSLDFDCIFSIPFFDKNSDFKIFHKISSVNSNDPKGDNYLPVREFQGKYIFDFDFNDQITAKLDLNDSGDYYNEILKNPCENLDFTGGIKDIKQKKEEDKSKLLQLGATPEFKFSHIYKESTIERNVTFLGTICLKDALESRHLEGVKFRLFLQKPNEKSFTQSEKNDSSEVSELDELIPGQIEEIFSDKKTLTQFKTDADSCLNIPISITHKVFDKQKYFIYIVHFLSEDLNLYGSVKIALNPWQRAFQAFQKTEGDYTRTNVDDIKSPELIINQFRSINLFPSYGIDKLLNISIFHRFYLLFQPFIMRPDNVALGLNHRSRELLRDGYYLVRVLIVRNPKETGEEAFQAVFNKDNLDKQRYEQVVATEEIDLKEVEYITHTDTVVRVKANFVNFYMPIYLSTKQMYYIASRNMMVIQIYPADPRFIHYKEDGITIDSEKTKWETFVGHDLINKPYAGAVNIQKWTNWNLLQPVNIDTDKIICSSKIGKKYKKFDFSVKNLESKNKWECDQESFQNTNKSQDDLDLKQKANEIEIIEHSKKCEQNLQVHSSLKSMENEIMTLELEYKESTVETEKEKIKAKIKAKREEEENLVDATTLNTDLIKEYCASKNFSPTLEIYQNEVQSKSTSDFLDKFSLENALQKIVLGDEKAEEFTKDLQKSYQDFVDRNRNQKNKSWKNYWWEVAEKKQDGYIKERSEDFLNKHPFFERHINKLVPYLHTTNFTSHLYTTNSTYFPVNFPSFESLHIKGNNNNYKIRDLIDTYIIMLKTYSQNDDFISLLFQFIQENKKLFNYDEELEIDLSDSCVQEDSQACSDAKFKLLVYSDLSITNDLSREEKLSLLLHSDIFKHLIFTNDISKGDFIKKQTFLFMMLFILPKDKFLSFLEKASNPYEDLQKTETGWFSSSEDLQEGKNSKLYLDDLQETLKNNQEEILERFDVSAIAKYRLNSLALDYPLEPIVYNREDSKDILTQEDLKDLIDEGIRYEKINDFKTLAFFKSLCSFWFEGFMIKYLDATTKLSSYTNYLRQFDYLQTLEHAYIRNHDKDEFFSDQFHLDRQSMVNEIDKEGDMKIEEKKCQKGYKRCVKEVFCFSKDITEILYCKEQKEIGFNQCFDWVEKTCSKSENQNLDLCSKKDDKLNITKKSCFEDVNYFCRLHPDKSICSDFQNRCFKEYTSCLGDQESQLFQTDWTEVLNDKTEPLNTCIRRFEEFFKIENKMIVYDISHQDSDLKYRGGYLQNFGISSNNSLGSYMNWTAQRGTTLSVSVSASVDPIKALESTGLGKLFKIFSISGAGSANQNQSTNESNSGRIAWDSRSGGAVFLTIGKADINIGVKKFQKCLVIKPRVHSFEASFQSGIPVYYKNVWAEGVKLLDKTAFSRSGLILCNPVEERKENLEQIQESYFYISQSNDDSNSQFLDLYDLANRPFVMVLRGEREFLKFFHLTRRSLQDGESTINEKSDLSDFVNYTPVIENIRKLNLQIREVTQMGFYPGIYDYGYNMSEEMEANVLKRADNKKTLIEYIPFNIFQVPPAKTKEKIPIH